MYTPFRDKKRRTGGKFWDRDSILTVNHAHQSPCPRDPQEFGDLGCGPEFHLPTAIKFARSHFSGLSAPLPASFRSFEAFRTLNFADAFQLHLHPTFSGSSESESCSA
jgi:hypothetical protein